MGAAVNQHTQPCTPIKGPHKRKKIRASSQRFKGHIYVNHLQYSDNHLVHNSKGSTYAALTMHLVDCDNPRKFDEAIKHSQEAGYGLGNQSLQRQ